MLNTFQKNFFYLDLYCIINWKQNLKKNYKLLLNNVIISEIYEIYCENMKYYIKLKSLSTWIQVLISKYYFLEVTFHFRKTNSFDLANYLLPEIEIFSINYTTFFT